MSEKPLHVQVAEVFGWTNVRRESPDSDVFWLGVPPKGWLGRPSQSHDVDGITMYFYTPPHYDTDWSATGPLIEKYGFWLRQLDQTLSGPQPWDAFRNDDLTFPRGFGPTPLLAVCNLIVRLAEAGILKAAEGR